MKHWPLLSWARYACVVATVAAILFIIPAAWFPFQLGKLAVFTIVLCIAALLFFLGQGAGTVFGKRGLVPALAVGLLPLAYLASWYVSTDRTVGLAGYSVEGDTVLFVALGFLTFILSFFLFRRSSNAETLLQSLSFATAVAVVFQFVVILFGSNLSFLKVFSDPSINLVGKWNDIGLLAGLVLMLAMLALQTMQLSMRRRIVLSVGAVVAVLFVALVQFELIWALLLVFSIALFIHSVLTSHNAATTHTPGRTVRALWLPAAGALVSIAFLLWGAIFQGNLIKVFPVTSLEVRPSFQSTLDILRASHGSSAERFLLGTGPQTFSNNWFMHKAPAINQTQFWSLNFNVGYSTLTTALTTVGAIGAILWLLPLLLVLWGVLFLVRTRAAFTSHEMVVAVALAASSIYLWATTVFYVPSQNLILLAFLLSGASLALSLKGAAESVSESAGARMGRLALTLFLLACVLFLAFATMVVARRYMSEVQVNKTLIALGENNPDKALVAAEAALSTERTQNALQARTFAGIAVLAALAQSTTPTQATQDAFTAQAQTTVGIAQEGIAKNPKDYRAYVALARVYELLAQIGVQGAYESSVQQYALALDQNPTNPEIPLAVARLAAAKGDTQVSEGALSKALELKPDYTDAILFAVQLYVANKDIKNAILAGQAAVRTAPGVPSIWFQLGLLYYSNNDFNNAIAAFEQAVSLQNDYANAKYFLGLSYANVKRGAEAIKQFEDLSVTNPTNAEVKLILSNLQAGKAPFDGAQPPVTSNPEDRTTAPIAQ